MPDKTDKRGANGRGALAAIAFVMASASPAPAYETFGDVETWPDGNIVLQLQLQSGGPSGVDWTQAAVDACTAWNRHMVDTQFTWVKNSSAAKGAQNRQNNVFWADNLYGEKLDKYTLGITAGWEVASDGSTIAEADVVFNTTAGPWAVYRGALRSDGTSDFRRVAEHEFGHVLGLDHPDEHYQSVTALMNSMISNTDDLAPDDIDGATYLYGPKAPSILQQPVNVAPSGTFSVRVGGRGPLTYRWRQDGQNVNDSFSYSYGPVPHTRVVEMEPNDQAAGTYDLVVANRYGVATSARAQVVVSRGIATPPVSQAVVQGTTATFKVVVKETEAVKYQWYFQKSGTYQETAITGATAATLTVKNVQAANLGFYWVIAQAGSRSYQSDWAGLSLKLGATLPAAPVGMTVGGSTTLSGTIDGLPHFSAPTGIAIDKSGNLFVTDTWNAVRKITPAGVVTSYVNLSGRAPMIDTNGELLLANDSAAYRVATGGAALPWVAWTTDYDGESASIAFGNAMGFARAANGDLLVTTAGSTVIWRLNPKSLKSAFVGGEGGGPRVDAKGTAARFVSLGPIVAGPGGVTYAVDYSDTYSVIRRIASDGTVTTLAGGATSNLQLKNGTGKAATFGRIQGLAIDAAGNLYATDSGTIRKITAGGVVTTLAGNAAQYSYLDGTGSAARFGQDCTLAAAANGTLYVADARNKVIRKVTSTGVVTTFSGVYDRDYSGATTDGGPVTYEWRKDGKAIAGATKPTLTLQNFQAADAGSYTLVVKNAAGTATSNALNVSLKPVITSQPASVLVMDGGTTTLKVVATSPSGRPLKYQWYLYGSPLKGETQATLTLKNLSGAMWGDYTVQISDGVLTTESPAIQVETALRIQTALADRSFPDGSPVRLAAGIYDAAAPLFAHPFGVAADRRGNVFVADEYNRAIRQISSTGNVTTLAGGKLTTTVDGKGAAAGFSSPRGLASDKADNLYVADAYAIRKVTPAGVVTTLAGSATASGSADGKGTAARFDYPVGLAVDDSGNVYVADSGNQTIRKITPAGVVTTVAGKAGQRDYANGQGSAARFATPEGIAVDAAGNLYVSDYNDVVRRITPAGLVQPFAGLTGQSGFEDGMGDAARFGYATQALAMDPSGDILFAEIGTARIGRISPAGLVTTIATGDPLGRIYNYSGIAPDGQGGWWATEPNANCVDRIRSDGAVARYAGGVAAGYRDGPITNYQWQQDGKVIAGATDSVLTIPNLQAADAGTYSVAVTNSYGTVTSACSVARTPSAPWIIAFADYTYTQAAGAALALSVTAGGTRELTYQWLHEGQPILGATGPTLSLPELRLADAGAYSVVACNALGSVISAPVSLNIAAAGAPVITAQPVNVSLGSGYDLSLSVATTGATSYQWRKDGVDIPGATAPTFTKLHALAADSGSYTVKATNAAGTTISNRAIVTVFPAQLASIGGWYSPFLEPGAAFSFNPNVFTTSAYTCQWRKNGVIIPGATSSTLAFAAVKYSDTGDYSLTVTTDAGSVTQSVHLTVQTKLGFTRQPDAQTMTVGGTLTVPLTLSYEGPADPKITLRMDRFDIPGGTYSFGGSGLARTLTIKVSADTVMANTDYIRITATDGVLEASTYFAVEVRGVNHPPVISAIGPQTIKAGTKSFTVAFTARDPEVGSLSSIIASSSNPKLVSSSGLAINYTDGIPAGLVITPVTGQTGSATITLKATAYSGLTSTRSFAFTVVAANHAPTISAIAAQTMAEDATASIAFTIGDADTSASLLSVTATSSNPTLFPAGGLTLSGSGANRTLKLRPAANASGKATVTLTVGDGAATTKRTFTVTVTAVNDAPTLAAIASQTVPENGATPAIPLAVADIDTALSSLKLTATTSDVTLLPTGGIVFGGSGANRTIRITPARSQHGATTVTVTVSDGKATAQRAFKVTVSPAPLPPALAAIADQTFDENQISAPIACTIADADTPLASLQLSAVSADATLFPTGAFTFAGSGANRTLRISPATDAHGSATVTVTVSDGKLTAARSFAVTVRPRPTVTAAVATRQVVTPGQALLLEVAAIATGTPHYRWFRDGHALDGTDAASYGRVNAGPADAGVYWVDVTDDGGTRRSAPFFVLVPSPETTVRAWGDPASAMISVPAGLGEVVALAAGSSHVLAAKADGTVAAWGANASGQCTVPAGLADVVAVAAGATHSLALQADGTVTAWGDVSSGATVVPAGLTAVCAIAAGDGFSLAVRTDGSVVKWGRGGAALPADLANVSAVSASGRQALALTTDGSVVSWGANVAAQVIPPLAARRGAQAVAAGATHSLVLHTDGTVTAWGENTFGQATVPADLHDATGIAAGGRHSLALRADGSIVAWGDNAAGQTTVPADLDLAAFLAAGDAASIVVTDTTPFAAPGFVTNPGDVVVAAGTGAVFTARATGYPTPDYRWQISTDGGATWHDLTDDADVSGTATSLLTIATVSADRDGARVRCVAHNAIDGDVSSSAAAITVTPAE